MQQHIPLLLLLSSSTCPLIETMMMMMMMMIIIINNNKHVALSPICSQLTVCCHSLLHQKQRIKTSNKWPNDNKYMITVVSVVVVVVMNIIIMVVVVTKVRRGSGFYNASRRKLSRVPSLKE